MLKEERADFAAIGAVQTERLVEDVTSDEVRLSLRLLAYVCEVQRGVLVVSNQHVLLDQVLDLKFHSLRGFDIVALEVKANHIVNIDRRTSFN